MKHIVAVHSQYLRRPVSALLRLMMAAAVVFAFLSSASAQTAVTPAGSGTEADPYQITVVGNLVWMGDTVASSSGKYYKLMNDIDASETAKWDGGKGFVPIGNDAARFKGVFDGNNKKITGLTIKRPDTDLVGLFGMTDVGSMIKNLGLENFTITGRQYCGGLAGYVLALSSPVLNPSALPSSSTLCVTNCYTNGSVSANVNGGGLVGVQAWCVISACYSAGSVSGSRRCGGLVGTQLGASVNNCYSTVSVSGEDSCGGLVGYQDGASISNCYSTGRVSGTDDCGGLVSDEAHGTVSDCYYDRETSGRSDTGKGTPKTTAEMKQRATFSGWDFASIWGIKEKGTYPYLLSLPPRQP